MAGNAITTAIFLVLVVADVSNASSFWKLRYLADEYPAKDNTTDPGPANSSSPIHLSGAKDLDPNSTSKLDAGLLNSATPPPNDKKDSKESGELEKVSPPPKRDIDGGSNSSSSSNSTNDKPTKKENVDGGKNPNNTKTGKGAAESEVDKEEEKNKNGDQGAETKEDKEEKNTNGDKTDSKSGVVETCDGVGVADNCTDGHYLSACIKDPGTGSDELIVLVHNSGSKTLKVNLTGLSDESKAVEVQKHGTEKINISLPISSKLVLSAGKGDCELVVKPLVPKGSLIFNLPSYDKLVTPVNGAYFLIVTVVIFGASWACCMFRKRGHDGIPYQELEMGLPESMAAADVETAEGWDEGWDDDWDEDKAVKSPAAHHVRNISANGLTARSSNRDDGWENDWDD